MIAVVDARRDRAPDERDHPARGRAGPPGPLSSCAAKGRTRPPRPRRGGLACALPDACPYPSMTSSPTSGGRPIVTA
jgi:hypothetical protein